jgi:hypothetical protein
MCTPVVHGLTQRTVLAGISTLRTGAVVVVAANATHVFVGNVPAPGGDGGPGLDDDLHCNGSTQSQEAEVEDKEASVDIKKNPERDTIDATRDSDPSLINSDRVAVCTCEPCESFRIYWAGSMLFPPTFAFTNSIPTFFLLYSGLINTYLIDSVIAC